LLLTSEQVSAVGRAVPLPMEVRLPMVQADVARALGLLDGQIVSALVEVRNERLRLVLQNRAIELPPRWRALLGQTVQLQVQQLASGAAQLAPLAQQAQDPPPTPLPNWAQALAGEAGAVSAAQVPARWLMVNPRTAAAMGLSQGQVLALRVAQHGSQLRWRQQVLDVPRHWRLEDGQTVGVWVRRLSAGVWALQPLTPVPMQVASAPPTRGTPTAPTAPAGPGTQATQATQPATSNPAPPPAATALSAERVASALTSQALAARVVPPAPAAQIPQATAPAPTPAWLGVASPNPAPPGVNPLTLPPLTARAIAGSPAPSGPARYPEQLLPGQPRAAVAQTFDVWPAVASLRTDQLDASAVRQALLAALGLWAPMVARVRHAAAEEAAGSPTRESATPWPQREWVFGLSLPFKDAPPVDLRFKRQPGNGGSQSRPHWEVHLHTQSEALGEVWVRTRLQDQGGVEVTLWAERDEVVADARRWRGHLARELQQASLQLTGFGAYPGSARPQTGEPQVPVGSLLDISS
jgi:hypothetical protein